MTPEQRENFYLALHLALAIVVACLFMAVTLGCTHQPGVIPVAAWKA